jgi:hypothetical protein
MTMSRAEHLAWCKQRALEYVDAGNLDGARQSMLIDLQKWEEPLYPGDMLAVLLMDAALFCKTSDQMRYWINGFN